MRSIRALYIIYVVHMSICFPIDAFPVREKKKFRWRRGPSFVLYKFGRISANHSPPPANLRRGEVAAASPTAAPNLAWPVTSIELKRGY